MSQAKIGLVQFLGSNCDQDCFDVMKRRFGVEVVPVWHTETSLPPLDGLILPGGFSYGDFLRGGGLAAHTKIMVAVKSFVDQGRAVLGICNGFQVLTETHLLPGALIRNASGTFVCETSELQVADGDTGYHRSLRGKSYQIPIAHGEGRYFVPDDQLKSLQDNGQILFTYRHNPNGSVANIAGVTSANGRVLGMMPHPERADDVLLDSQDGVPILESFLEACLG